MCAVQVISLSINGNIGYLKLLVVQARECGNTTYLIQLNPLDELITAYVNFYRKDQSTACKKKKHLFKTESIFSKQKLSLLINFMQQDKCLCIKLERLNM